MCHAMPFSARALKNETFSLTLILCGKKQIDMWFFVVCTLIDIECASLLLSQALFLIVSAYWRVQAANLHNVARALSNPSRCF